MNIYTRIGLHLTAAFFVLSATVPAGGADIRGRELFGIRIGGVIGSSMLDNSFGKGTEIELHFIEGLGSWYGVAVAVSSHNFGDSKNRERNIEFTGLDRAVEMQIYSGTVAFFTVGSLGRNLSVTGEAGFGLYSITAIIEAGIYEGHLTDNQFGMYTGVGFLYQLTQRLSLNASGKLHYILSGDDDRHAMYFYTGEERTRIYQITVGVTIFTG